MDPGQLVQPGQLIAAPVTPPGVGGVAIVRLSGDGTWNVAKSLLPTIYSYKSLRRRLFFHCILRDPATGDRIDEAVVLGFPAPHSYTGEEVVEFQVHGGRMPTRKLMEVLLSLGVRMAGPGEFTRRAFLNGRIDLSQAEAVMDLVGAQSERARQMALEQLQGALRQRLEAAYKALLALCADLEASLDFAEDEVPAELSFSTLHARMAVLETGLVQLLDTWKEGQVLREGVQVVISGRPNAGKSALFNALLGRSRAIVTDQPGTTRDTIEETLLLDGIPVRLVDTAGLRATDSLVEREGVARATEVVRLAHLHLRVFDPGMPWTAEDRQALLALPADRTVVVINKADLHPDEAPCLPEGYGAVRVSALTGEGLDGLRAALVEAMGLAGQAESQVAVNARHRDALLQGLEALRRAQALCGAEDAVLVAQALRESADALGVITGRNVGEDVLDQLFARFCVGK